MQKLIGLIVVLLIIAGGAYYWQTNLPKTPENSDVVVPQQEATTTPEVATIQAEETIGTSVSSAPIKAYNFGTGTKKILFVAGIHGGYEWNTVLLANQLIDYLKANPAEVPEGVSVTVIPVVNPDGLAKVVGSSTVFTVADVNKSQTVQVSGRYNANTVDLNRNFDCDWQAKGVWQSKQVSGGSAAFSEPETKAMQSYVATNKPSAVVVWYSSAGGVFASNCHDGVLPETKAIMDTFAKASGYKAYDSWDFYATTGDMANWLAKEKIPAVSVLLTNHTDTEWDKNLAGIKALLTSYATVQ